MAKQNDWQRAATKQEIKLVSGAGRNGSDYHGVLLCPLLPFKTVLPKFFVVPNPKGLLVESPFHCEVHEIMDQGWARGELILNGGPAIRVSVEG